MAPINSPSVPVKLEPQTDKDIIEIVKMYLQKFNLMEPSERFAVTEAIRFICNPLWKIEGMAAPIETEWLKKQSQKKEVKT